VRWIRDRTFPTPNDPSRVYQIEGIPKAITDRKQAAQFLQQNMDQDQLLARITQRIRTSLDLHKVLESTVTEARKVLQGDRVLFYRVYPNSTGVVTAASILLGWPCLLNFLAKLQVQAKLVIPIVALTALVVVGDRNCCLAAGANEYLSKPVNLKQLIGIVQQLLSSWRRSS